MLNTFTDLRRIKRDIQFKIFLLWLWGAFLGVAMTLYMIASTTLFLQVYQTEALARAFFVAGSVGLVSSILMTILQAYQPFARLGLLFCGIICGGVYWFYTGIHWNDRSNELYKDFIFWSFVGWMPIHTVVLLVFEGVFSRLFNVQESKKWSDIAGLGITLSAIFTLYLLPYFHTWNVLNMEDLMGYAASIFGASLILLLTIILRFPQLNQIKEDLKEIHHKNNFFVLLENHYFTLLAGFICIAVIIATFTDYFFLSILKTKYTLLDEITQRPYLDLEKMVSFLSVFLAVALTFNFFIKLLIYRYVVSKYSLRVGLMILPLLLGVFLLSSLVVGFYFGLNQYKNELEGFVLFFILLSICKLIKDAFDDSLQMPIYRLYLMPIDVNLRFDTQIKLEGITKDIGIWITGVCILLFTSFGWKVLYEIMFSIFLVVTLLYLTQKLYVEYRKKLEKRLTQEPELSKINAQQVFLPLSEQIVASIHQIPATQIEIYLNILQILNPVAYRKAILKLLDSTDNYIQLKLYDFDSQIQQEIKNIPEPVLKTLSRDNFSKGIIEISHQYLPLEEKLKDIISLLDSKSRNTLLEENIREKLLQIKPNFQAIFNQLKEENRTISLHIREDVQKVALYQAGKLCILEAIPLLDIVMKSKYFPILDNAELIQQTFSKLRGAEFRLERIKYIRQLTLSKQKEERVFGALLTTYSSENTKEELLQSLFYDKMYQVRYHAVVASAQTNSLGLQKQMIEKLDDPLYSNAAFSAIVATQERMLSALESAFYSTGQKELIQLRIIQIYGRIGTKQAIEFIISKIKYSNQNVSLLALDTLSKCGYQMTGDNALMIRGELEDVCRNLVWNMSVFLDLKKNKVSALLQEAIENEIEDNYDKIFSLLALIYNPNSVKLIRDNLNSGIPEKAEFSLELSAVLLEDTLQPFIMPLLDISTTSSEKMNLLKDFAPVKSMEKREALVAIVQRDYKWLNRWTKACALAELNEMTLQIPEPNRTVQDIEIFLANLVNPDEMLSEIAYKALFQLNRNEWQENISILRSKNNYHNIEALIHRMQYLENEKILISRLKFDLAKFLRNVDEFKEITGLTLAEIAKITELQEYTAQQLVAEYESLEEMDYFIVYSGTIVVMSDKIIIQRYTERQFLHTFHYVNQEIHHVKIWAETNSIIYKIPRAKFNELISFFEEIPNSILNYNQILFESVNVLYQRQELDVINSLAMREIAKIADLEIYEPSSIIAHYNFGENMNYCIVYAGNVQVLSHNKELKRITAKEMISRNDFAQNQVVPNVRLVALEKSMVYKILYEPFQYVKHLLSIIHFIKKTAELKELSDISLLEIAKIADLRTYREGESLGTYATIQELEFWIVIKGKIEMTFLRNEKLEKTTLESKDFVHYLKYLTTPTSHFELIALTNCEVYKLNKDKFNELIGFYDQIPLAILKFHFAHSLYEIIRFLAGTKDFKGMETMEILPVALATSVKEYPIGERIMSYTDVEEMDYFVVYMGQVELQYGKNEKIIFDERSVINPFQSSFLQNTGIRIFSKTACIVYRIPKSKIVEIFTPHSLNVLSNV